MKFTIDQLLAIEEKTGDSFYVLREQDFEKNFVTFSDAFRRHYNNTNLGYSLKTNYIPYVCRRAVELGGYAEIVSPLEFEIIQKLKIPGDRVIYNGPIMDYDSLTSCLLAGSKINIDNNTELQLVVDFLERNPEAHAHIGVRLNFDLGDGEFSRFGYDPASQDFLNFKQVVYTHSRIKLVGLHFHATRGNKSVQSYEKRLTQLLQLFETLPSTGDIRYIDLGGGFYGAMDDNIKSQFSDNIPSFEDYGSAIGILMKKYFPSEQIELILEPGLALTVNILDFYTKVLNVKHIRGKKVISLSGSFYNVKPSGHKRNLSIVHYKNKATGSREFDQDSLLVGFTCLENDVLYHNYSGESILEGDYISFSNVGAYTIVFKPPFIKLAPPIIIVADHSVEMVRAHEKFEDIFKAYTF